MPEAQGTFPQKCVRKSPVLRTLLLSLVTAKSSFIYVEQKGAGRGGPAVLEKVIAVESWPVPTTCCFLLQVSRWSLQAHPPTQPRFVGLILSRLLNVFHQGGLSVYIIWISLICVPSPVFLLPLVLLFLLDLGKKSRALREPARHSPRALSLLSVFCDFSERRTVSILHNLF